MSQCSSVNIRVNEGLLAMAAECPALTNSTFDTLIDKTQKETYYFSSSVSFKMAEGLMSCSVWIHKKMDHNTKNRGHFLRGNWRPQTEEWRRRRKVYVSLIISSRYNEIYFRETFLQNQKDKVNLLLVELIWYRLILNSGWDPKVSNKCCYFRTNCRKIMQIVSNYANRMWVFHFRGGDEALL